MTERLACVCCDRTFVTDSEQVESIQIDRSGGGAHRDCAAAWRKGYRHAVESLTQLCEVCHEPISGHTLEQSHGCLGLVVDQFCRLTGPVRR